MGQFAARAAHSWFCYLYSVDRIFSTALEPCAAGNPLSLIGLRRAHTFASTVLFCFVAALIPITLFIARGSPSDFELSER